MINQVKKNLYLFISILLFLSFSIQAETILRCDFASWTDNDGRTFSKDYYKKNYPTQRSLWDSSVFVEVDTSNKTVTFYLNDNLFSVHLGTGHNGKTDGKSHTVDFKEKGNYIVWYFRMKPLNNYWEHSLDRYGGRLKVQYMSSQVTEYDCNKTDSLF